MNRCFVSGLKKKTANINAKIGTITSPRLYTETIHTDSEDESVTTFTDLEEVEEEEGEVGEEEDEGSITIETESESTTITELDKDSNLTFEIGEVTPPALSPHLHHELAPTSLNTEIKNAASNLTDLEKEITLQILRNQDFLTVLEKNISFVKDQLHYLAGQTKKSKMPAQEYQGK